MGQNNLEPVDVFDNGCMYYAHTMVNQPWHQKQREIGFHTIVFYEEFSGQNVVASLRGPISWGNEQVYIRKLVDSKTPIDEMQKLCLETLVSTLRQDVAKDWYADKVFILGEKHPISIQDHIKKTSDFPIPNGYLTLRNFIKP